MVGTRWCLAGRVPDADAAARSFSPSNDDHSPKLRADLAQREPRELRL
jgi:hypothetical protein